MKKRVLLVEDHEIVRDALRFYFTEADNYEIVDEAEDGVEAMTFLQTNKYDILITDINMPNMNGIELVGEIRKKEIDIKILVLSMFDDIKSIKKMLEVNVNGYVLKDTGKVELMHALNKIIIGEDYYSPDVHKRVLESMKGHNLTVKKRLTIQTELSDREKDVLQLIMQEKSNQEIADSLFISVRTAEGHKRNILSKTGCKNLVGLTLYAVEHNLIPL